MKDTVKIRAFMVGQAEISARPLESALYLVATPIGNLGDITLRALETLAAADVLACEDTRVTRVPARPLRHPPAANPLSRAQRGRGRPPADRGFERGKSVALVSDAGTPLVSDPGFRLVEQALAAGIRVIPIPGPSAVLAALTASGAALRHFSVRRLPAGQGRTSAARGWRN